MAKGSGTCSRAPLMGADFGSRVMPLPDEKDFYINTRDGYTLIHPRKTKHVWAAHERLYRSLILDAQGRVVSSGFPKFGNLGEPGYEDVKTKLEQSLAGNGEVWLTDKMDGSLGIRSVINGQVVFRTRGSFDGGDFGPAMRAVATAKYPALLDPTVAPDESLLFEFVSPRPEFKIVIRYDEDNLVFLGGVRHKDLSLLDKPDIERYTEQYNLDMVATTTVPSSVDELVSAVSAWEGKEGVVARVQGGQDLVKVKAQAYLALHRLRSHLTASSVREQCETHSVENIEDFNNIIYGLGGDWEMTEDARPLVEMYLHGKKQGEIQLAALQADVAQAAQRYPARKDFAQQYAMQLDPTHRAAAFLLLDNKTAQARTQMRAKILDALFASAQARDEQQSETL